MADYTADQYREAARKAMAAGDTAAAQRLIAAGRALPPPQHQNTLGGVVDQFGAGSQSGIAGALGFPVDAMTGLLNALAPRPPMESGFEIGPDGNPVPTFGAMPDQQPMIKSPVGGSGFFGDMLEPFNEHVPAPQSRTERVARRVGEDVGASATMLPLAFASPAVRAAPGAGAIVEGASALGSGLGGATANEVAPGSITADIVGALLGGITGGGLAAKYTGLNATPAEMRGGIDEQKARASDAYGEVNADQRIIPQDQIDDMALGLSENMDNNRINPRLQPGSSAVLDAILEDSSNPMRIEDVENLRRLTESGLPAGASGADKRLAGIMKGDITSFLDDLGDQVADRLREGRDAHRRASAAASIEDAGTKASRRAARTGSGGNEINATRQNISRLIENPRTARSFKPNELAMMDEVVRGSTTQNAARRLSRFAPSSGGLSAMLGMGAAVASPQFALPVAALTEGAKAYGEKSSRKLIEALMQSIAPERVLKPGDSSAAGSRIAMLLARIGAKDRD